MTAETSDATRRPRSADGAAIGFVLLSSLLYMLGYSLSKTLVGTYGLSAVQVTFLRCAIVLVGGCVALAWPRSGVTARRLWRPVRAWEQRAAAAALVASNILAILAYSLMPVTEASALGFTAPLLLTALGGLFLNERVSVNRWLGAGLGFAGMLLIVRPGVGNAGVGIVMSIGAAMTYATYQVLVRRLRDVATSLDTALQVALVGVVLLAGAMVPFWRPLSWAGFAMALLFTIVQTAALASIAAALRRSEASRLAPWQFSGLLWAMVLDAVMFGGLPTIGSVAGGGLIIAGGLLAQRWRSRPGSPGAVIGQTPPGPPPFEERNDPARPRPGRPGGYLMTEERAVLAGGCFWGVQDLVRRQPGVISTRVGYTGGEVPNATYRNHGNHAEAIEILFDPAKTSYRTMLEFFFQIHDPSTLNRQGNDRGASYRSAIFYTSDEQRRVAKDTIADVDASGLWPGKVVTEVVPASDFWEAEPEHQDYLERIPNGYTCHFIRPNWKLPRRADVA